MKKILLVSNLEAFLGRNKNLLNRVGFIISTATSAEEALQKHREEPVDLVISMLDLPGAGGDTLCSWIRQDKDLKQVPVILVCYETEADLERASKCEANASVIRPVRPELLLKQIARFLAIPTRRNFRAPFNAIISGTTADVPFSGMTRNISVSGLLVEAPVRLNPDDMITNMLLAINSHEIVADGKIVWAEDRADGKHNYGLQFTRLSSGSTEAIESYVAAPQPG